MIKKLYDNVLLKYSTAVLLTLLVCISALGYYSTKLEIDASAETLLLDDDKDLKFTREIKQRYSNPNFLVTSSKHLLPFKAPLVSFLMIYL